MKKEDFKKLILKSISSGDDFKTSTIPIRDELAKENKGLIKHYLDTIFHTISDKKAPVQTRFYALFSLKTVTESTIPLLINELFARSSDLKTLQEHATFDKNKEFPERGATFFSPKPTKQEETAGNNYLALLLEMIKYWDMKFGKTEKGKDNPPRTLFKKLSENLKVPFPEEFYYYKLAQKNPAQQGEEDTKDAQGGKKTVPSQQDAKKAAESKQTAGKEQEIQKAIQEKFQIVRGIKEELWQIYQEDQGEVEVETLKLLFEDLGTVHKQLSEILALFLSKNPPVKNETIVNQLLEENNETEAIFQEFKKFVEGKSKWPEHKDILLAILSEAEDNQPADLTGAVSADKLFAAARKISAPVIRTNASNLFDDVDVPDGNKAQDQQVTNDKVRKPEEKKIKEESKSIEQASRPTQAKETDKKVAAKEEIALNPKQKLLLEARKIIAPLIRLNASNLYEDVDYPDEPEKQELKVEIEEGARGKKPPTDESIERIREEEEEANEKRLAEQKASVMKRIQETKLREERAREEQRLKEEKEKKELRMKEEQRLKAEKEKEEQKIKEEKRRQDKKVEEEQRIKAEKEKEVQRLREEKAKEDQRIKAEKANEEQKLKEEKAKEEEQRIKDEKAREDKRARDQMTREEQKLKEEIEKAAQTKKDNIAKESVKIDENSQKEGFVDNQKGIALVDDHQEDKLPPTSKDSGKLQGNTDLNSLTQAQQPENKDLEVTIAENYEFYPKLEKPVVHSVFMKKEDVPPQIEEKANASRGMLQAFRLDQSTVANKFVSELKMMEQSIKVARDRSSDMESIRDAIKQSFIIRKRQPPNYKELIDKGLLKSIEEQLEKLKKEKMALQIANQEFKLSTPDSKPEPKPVIELPPVREEPETIIKIVQDPELKEQTLTLQKECEEYQQVIEMITKENGELKLNLKQIQTKVESLDSLSVSIEELEMLKIDNRDLLDKVRALEDRLTGLQHAMSPNKSESVVANSLYEAQELREKLRKIYEENEGLKNTLDLVKKQRLLSRDQETSDTLNAGYQDNYDSYRQPRTTSKTENPSRQPRTRTIDYQEDELNFNRLKSEDPVAVSQPNRNIFGKTREIIIQTGNEDYLLDIPEPRKSANASGEISSKTASKHEIHNLRSQSVKNLEVISPVRVYNRQGLDYLSPLSQKTEGSLLRQKGSRDADDKASNSLEVNNGQNLQDLKSFRSGLQGISESEEEHDIIVINGEQVSSDAYILKELKLRLDIAGRGISLYQFKISCLNPKSLLFENDFIQIGLTSNLVQDYGSARNVLKLVVYYGNKLDDDISEFRVSLSEGLNLNVLAKPQTVESVVPKKGQLKQQFLISFTSVPFGCVQLTCEGLFGRSYMSFSLPMPNLLTKFMEFKYIELSDYRRRWRQLEKNILMTEPITVNSGLIRNASDFKKYFGYLIDIRTKNEGETTRISRGIKYGGLFELDIPKVEHLLRINILPSGEIVFQLATEEQNRSLAEYLLQTLVFIFKR